MDFDRARRTVIVQCQSKRSRRVKDSVRREAIKTERTGRRVLIQRDQTHSANNVGKRHSITDVVRDAGARPVVAIAPLAIGVHGPVVASENGNCGGIIRGADVDGLLTNRLVDPVQFPA